MKILSLIRDEKKSIADKEIIKRKKLLAKTYANKESPKKLLINSAFWLVNVSKPNFPRYLPIPLWPTPPNGSVSTINK